MNFAGAVLPLVALRVAVDPSAGLAQQAAVDPLGAVIRGIAITPRMTRKSSHMSRESRRRAKSSSI
jgi:hypothetical protein